MIQNNRLDSLRLQQITEMLSTDFVLLRLKDSKLRLIDNSPLTYVIKDNQMIRVFDSKTSEILRRLDEEISIRTNMLIGDI